MLKRLLFVLVLLIAARASAEPSQPSGRQAKERAAKKACAAGDVAQGVDILAELYVDTNDETYVYNQGRCYEQNGRLDQATDRFREFLRKAPTTAKAERAVAVPTASTSCTSTPAPHPPSERGQAFPSRAQGQNSLLGKPSLRQQHRWTQAPRPNATPKGRNVARDSCIPSLLSSVRAQDPGAPWPHGGAAQPSLRPILGNHPVNPDEGWRRFDLVPSFCGGQPDATIRIRG